MFFQRCPFLYALLGNFRQCMAALWYPDFPCIARWWQPGPLQRGICIKIQEKAKPRDIVNQCSRGVEVAGFETRPFGPEFENVLIFPTLSANIRKLPVFSAFFRFFIPPVSGNFEAILNWTFGLSFTLKGAIPGCNRAGCSITAALSSKS